MLGGKRNIRNNRDNSMNTQYSMTLLEAKGERTKKAREAAWSDQKYVDAFEHPNKKKRLKKQIKNFFKIKGAQIADTAEDVGSATARAYRSAKDATVRGAKRVGKAASNMYHSAKEKISNLRTPPKPKSKVQKVKDAISSAGSKAWNKTKKLSQSAKEQYQKLPKSAKVAIPATVLAGGAAAIYAWWKKNHKK